MRPTARSNSDDAVVGQAGDGVEHGRDQGCAAAQRRQRAQMLRREAGALARKLAQALGVDAFGAGRIEPIALRTARCSTRRARAR